MLSEEGVDKKTLPIVKKPIICSYLHYAFPFSILLTNPYYTDWLLNNFIQVIYAPNDLCSFDYHEALYNQWPCFKSKTLYLEDFERHGTTIIDYIKKELTNNVYVIGWVDMYYIPKRNCYQKEHKQHGLLLYGFDDESQSFSALFYDQNNQYSAQEISYKNFLNSCYGKLPEGYRVYIDFLEINSGACVDYNFYSIQYKLRCYLSSKSYDVDDVKYHHTIDIETYGLNAFHELSAYIENKREGEKIDLRFPYVFFEHTSIMIYRIKMIFEEYPLSIFSIPEEDAQKLINNAKQVLYMCIKYNQTQDRNILPRIVSKIKNVLTTETEMLLPIVNYERDPDTVKKRRDGNPRYKPLHI